MQSSGRLVTSDTIKSQLSWRLPEPVLPADPMLTAPILPMLVRLSLPNMMAMLAMALVTIAETAWVRLGRRPWRASRWYFRSLHWRNCGNRAGTTHGHYRPI
jgi:hypothetical protein